MVQIFGAEGVLKHRLSRIFTSAAKQAHPTPFQVAQFILAAEQGNEEKVDVFCKKFPDDIDTPNRAGDIALDKASLSLREKIVDILLEAKADPNKTGAFVHAIRAVEGDISPRAQVHPDQHVFFVDGTGTVTEGDVGRDETNDEYKAYLQKHARQLSVIEKLKKAGGDINAQSDFRTEEEIEAAADEKSREVLAEVGGMTPLMGIVAAAVFVAGNADVLRDQIELHLALGADPRLKNDEGKTAKDIFIEAIEKYKLAGDPKIIEGLALLEKAETTWCKEPVATAKSAKTATFKMN